MSTFAYSVAIKLSVANLASQGIRILAKDLLAAHGNAVSLGDKLKALKMVAVGYGMDKAGEGILGFMGKSIDASKEYTRQLSLMNAAGMTQRDIAQATASAWQTSQTVITSSATENLKAIRELRTVFGNQRMGEAYGILPTVQRTKGILEALTGKEQEGVAFDMVKAIELRTPGLMSAQRMQQNADLMAQSLMAMGGTLNVHDFHMAIKQAKTSAFGLNDEFVYKYLPTLIQEVKTGAGGAQTAGTALMSTYAAVVQGVLKKSAIPLWEQMGLIGSSDVVKNSTGALQLKPGAVKGAQLFQANPYEWANTVLAPAMAKYGADHNLNREQVISGLFGNRNAQWFVNTMIGKAPQFERDRQLIGSSGNSYQTYQKLLQTNPQLAEQAMHAQWNNILSVLGYKVLPALIPWMIRFATGLDRIGQFMERHGTMTSVIAFGLIGLGSALMIIGKALMTVGLIKFLGMGPLFTTIATRMGAMALVAAPWAAAIIGIGVAAYELYAHWDAVRAGLGVAWGAITSGFTKFINFIIGLANHLPFVHLQPIGGSSGSPYVPAAAPKQFRFDLSTHLDGRKVAQSTTYHQAKAASGPNQGTSTFDFSRAYVPPSLMAR